MLAATCPHCHHAIFADDGTALETLNCPACQRPIGALVLDVDHDSSFLAGASGAPITELPVIDTGEPEAPPEPIDQGQVGAASLVASDNPYAAPQPVDGVDYPPAKAVTKRELADLYERFIGALIDWGLYGVAWIFGYYLWLPLAWIVPDLQSVVLPFTLAAVAVLLVAIPQWILISLTAQSFGKRVMGTYIVRHRNGELVGFVRGVLLRSWVAIAISAFYPPRLLFIDTIPIFLPMRRCLHDLLAGTDVVRYRKLQSWERK
jgi:uncharacterized RDD family membrane protein YckC